MSGGVPTTTLSARGNRAKQRPFTYFDAFVRTFSDPYDAETNPRGFINLAVAQNQLTVDAIQQRLREALTKEGTIPDSSASYDDMKGSARLRKAMAAHLRKRVATAGTSVAKALDRTLTPENIIISSGAGAVIENLAFCVANEDDFVMIPAPYYPAFPNDLRARLGVACAPVRRGAFAHIEYEKLDSALHKVDQNVVLESLYHLPTPEDFERDMRKMIATKSVGGEYKGKCAAIIICNPENPTGVKYGGQEVANVVEWAVNNRIHVIIDEVYACSSFNESKTEHLSGFDIALSRGDDCVYKDYVHVIYSLSKDFCASGYRIGALWTQNAEVHRSMDNISYFCAVPGPMQCALCEVMEDDDWMDWFVKENARRLKSQYDCLVEELKALNELNDDFDLDRRMVTPASGMFVFIDLSPFLKGAAADGPASETSFWNDVYDEAKLVLTPGRDCEMNIVGWYRICFASVPRETLTTGIRRLVDVIRARR